ncbi:MAG: flagellar hook-length control protein FliK [Spirochaetaceae bacterium]|jgi:flagellar hook-length control protein FliK|nr:flagellar hook-length control protein FliK [Spirochaetaceae bacterium]
MIDTQTQFSSGFFALAPPSGGSDFSAGIRQSVESAQTPFFEILASYTNRSQSMLEEQDDVIKLEEFAVDEADSAKKEDSLSENKKEKKIPEELEQVLVQIPVTGAPDSVETELLAGEAESIAQAENGSWQDAGFEFLEGAESKIDSEFHAETGIKNPEFCMEGSEKSETAEIADSLVDELQPVEQKTGVKTGAEKDETSAGAQTVKAEFLSKTQKPADEARPQKEKLNLERDGKAELQKNGQQTEQKAVFQAKFSTQHESGGENKENASFKRREKSVKIELRETREALIRNSQVTETTQEVRHVSNISGKETEFAVEIKTAPHNAPNASPMEIPSSTDAKAASSLENFLARELHQNLNGDIVREANIMLRSGGDATIRLALHPASLGSVKIKLEVLDNKITGKIIVESEEALRAFQRETSSLEDAFRASGFDGAALETALSGGGNAADEETRTRQNRALALLNTRYEDSAGKAESAGIYFGSEYTANSVNVFV